MSRGVRDLRDLICVSRLTFRASDDEIVSDEEGISKDFDRLSLGSSGSCDSRQSSASGTRKVHPGATRVSPDSGFVTNGGSPPEVSTQQKENVHLDLSTLKERKHKKKKKRKPLGTEPTRHLLPKPPPLPPVGRSISREEPAPSVTPDSTEMDVDEELQPVGTKSKSLSAGFQLKRPVSAQASRVETGNYDEMLCFMDATVVSNWLSRANQSLSELCQYIYADDHFVKFAHFWLTDFQDLQKREIYQLEIDILREEMGFAFAVGRDQMKISQRDISNIISALFREYPNRLLSSKGAFLFLDVLDTLTSTRTPEYKKLLSDVKCSTKNRQYVQWLLASRSFALVSIWSAIVNFYRNLLGKHGVTEGLPIPSAPTSYRSVHEKRLFQSLRLGYVDVIHYFNMSEKVNLYKIDSHERTLIFTAVMYNQPRVVQYLIKRVKPPIKVNHPSDTGNTALHAAANSGNAVLVRELLTSSDININCQNSQCDDATPLHLAVMHGHSAVVELLAKAGADKSLKMGDLSPVDMARDFDHPEIMKFFTD